MAITYDVLMQAIADGMRESRRRFEYLLHNELSTLRPYESNWHYKDGQPKRYIDDYHGKKRQAMLWIGCTSDEAHEHWHKRGAMLPGVDWTAPQIMFDRDMLKALIKAKSARPHKPIDAVVSSACGISIPNLAAAIGGLGAYLQMQGVRLIDIERHRSTVSGKDWDTLDLLDHAYACLCLQIKWPSDTLQRNRQNEALDKVLDKNPEKYLDRTDDSGQWRDRSLDHKDNAIDAIDMDDDRHWGYTNAAG